MLVKTGKKDAGMEDQVAFLIASGKLKCEKNEKWAYGMDFTTSGVISEEKKHLSVAGSTLQKTTYDNSY